ncbi:predicted protein [Nematostella vectensis]|uniref:Phospholipase A2-like central domain-containing protein n=1 Tax=Nematostella vectensis TaxID=45351 RepID=A7S6V0_NEMVE|nr:uncharacterized protein LOC5512342 [Nematostella vectensis]EDO40621.1 predicted protein [Nematostella vectensis]|eukprot:XP_001632684.1 predicted protein [Nematostella vectensis]
MSVRKRFYVSLTFFVGFCASITYGVKIRSRSARDLGLNFENERKNLKNDWGNYRESFDWNRRDGKENGDRGLGLGSRMSEFLERDFGRDEKQEGNTYRGAGLGLKKGLRIRIHDQKRQENNGMDVEMTLKEKQKEQNEIRKRLNNIHASHHNENDKKQVDDSMLSGNLKDFEDLRRKAAELDRSQVKGKDDAFDELNGKRKMTRSFSPLKEFLRPADENDSRKDIKLGEENTDKYETKPEDEIKRDGEEDSHKLDFDLEGVVGKLRELANKQQSRTDTDTKRISDGRNINFNNRGLKKDTHNINKNFLNELRDIVGGKLLIKQRDNDQGERYLSDFGVAVDSRKINHDATRDNIFSGKDMWKIERKRNDKLNVRSTKDKDDARELSRWSRKKNGDAIHSKRNRNQRSFLDLISRDLLTSRGDAQGDHLDDSQANKRVEIWRDAINDISRYNPDKRKHSKANGGSNGETSNADQLRGLEEGSKQVRTKARQQDHRKTTKLNTDGKSWCPQLNAKGHPSLKTHGLEEIEKCCIAHDQCPLIKIMGVTALDCQCENAFYACLKQSGAAIANTVGLQYFNASPRNCYQYTQVSVCEHNVCRSVHEIHQTKLTRF